MRAQSRTSCEGLLGAGAGQERENLLSGVWPLVGLSPSSELTHEHMGCTHDIMLMLFCVYKDISLLAIKWRGEFPQNTMYGILKQLKKVKLFYLKNKCIPDLRLEERIKV